VTLEAIQANSPFKPPPAESLDNVENLVDKLPSDNAIAPPATPIGNEVIEQAKPLSQPAKDTPPDDVSVPLQAELTPADKGPLKPSDVARKHPDHHPKTVHLPPREVQEELLRARRQSRDEFRAAQLREAEGQPPAEIISSPSSTVGAWSTATPMPADPSPVTSVGDDVTHLPDRQERKPQDAQIAGDDAMAQKLHHDSLLDVPKENAQNEPLGSEIASPDVQLRLEQEQAARASRDAATAASTTAVLAKDQIESTPMPAATEQVIRSPDVAESAEPVHSVPDLAENLVKAEPPQPLADQDPARESPAVQSAPAGASEDPPARMTTRVSSGTMRQKSVSEIIGQPPKMSLARSKRPSIQGRSPSVTSVEVKAAENKPSSRRQRLPADPGTQQTGLQRKRQHEHLKLNEGYEALRGAAEDPSKDYLEPLFNMQICDNLPSNKSLSELLQKANKVLSTSDQYAGIHERQDYRILRRIYALQNANKWSFRQMQPLPEPAGPKTHMDHLLSEMKWMRTDFRAERKLRKEYARLLAEACADWVASDAAGRLEMQVVVKSPVNAKVSTNAPHSPADTSFGNNDTHVQEARSPRALDASNEQGYSANDDFDAFRTPLCTIAAASVFEAMNVSEEDTEVLYFDQFSAAIEGLPIYVPFADATDTASHSAQSQVPAVSKYCEGKIITQSPSPLKKRSRYDYDDDREDELPKAKRVRAKDGSGVSPEQTDVALFDPENKLLRDRLHSNTAFRPPSEFPMPSSQFYEFRISSQWIAEDDQLLRRLAKDYSFNWSLIADEMSLPSNMSGSADRRTPWECFERWVELESLPNEMRKTVYFKTWNSRMETAQRNNDHRYQAQLQAQSQTPNQPQNIVRRRTQPVRVEKRRTNRYLHVVDAMRKNARKREQHAHKQAEGEFDAYCKCYYTSGSNAAYSSKSRFIAQAAGKHRH